MGVGVGVGVGVAVGVGVEVGVGEGVEVEEGIEEDWDCEWEIKGSEKRIRICGLWRGFVDRESLPSEILIYMAIKTRKL